MKKFLAIAAIAIAFTACNDEKKSEEVTTKDTSTVVTPVAPAADTNQVVTTTTVSTDTTKMKADTSNKK